MSAGDSLCPREAGRLTPAGSGSAGGPAPAEPGPVFACRAGCVQIPKREEEGGGSVRGIWGAPSRPAWPLLGGGVRRVKDRPRVRCHTGIAPEAGGHRWGSHGPPGPARSSGKGDESFVLCCRSPFCPQLRILSPGRAGGRLLTSGENFVAYS